MTERTHDLAALTALTISIVVLPMGTMSLGTLTVALLANQIGSAVPDFDQPTAEFYRELPAGSLIGKLFAPLLGGHRFISHSLLGMFFIGWGFQVILGYIHNFLLVDMNIVWWAFMLGFASHLIMDSFTKEGVPWLFPLPYRLGIPPFKFLRVTTGKFVEKFLIYPSLVLINGYIIYEYYDLITSFFGNHIIR